MPLTFPEELLIGVDEVDVQHRQLYAEINKLHEAMRSHDLEHVILTADYLARYATEHFSTEERLMIETGYPGFPEHLQRHTAFKQDLERWRSRLVERGPTAELVVDLSSWLTQWLRDHIRNVDAKMASFLRDRRHPSSGGRR